jgi:hypothetical protein
VTSRSLDCVHALMTQSLAAWRLAGRVVRSDDGALNVSCNGDDIRIERAPADVPFRWMVTIGGRRRGAISVVAVLRQVRARLDPGYAAQRLRVAPVPVVPP